MGISMKLDHERFVCSKPEIYFLGYVGLTIDGANIVHHLLIDTAALLPLSAGKLSESVCCPTFVHVLQGSSSSYKIIICSRLKVFTGQRMAVNNFPREI